MFPDGKTESQELALVGSPDYTFLLVNLEFQFSFEKLHDVIHHTVAGPLAFDIDIAVVCVAHELVASFLQLPVQHVKHDV